MFVQKILWSVPSDVAGSALEIVSQVHHDMDACGGLVKGLAGLSEPGRQQLLSLTFWKGWEDISRYLASSKSASYDELMKTAVALPPKLEHFEVIREDEAQQIDTISGELHWSFCDLSVKTDRVEPLLDALHYGMSVITGSNAGAWILLDRADAGHLALAVAWLVKPGLDLKQAIFSDSAMKHTDLFSLQTRQFKLHASDPVHVSA